jgi:hypothetical protein
MIVQSFITAATDDLDSDIGRIVKKAFFPKPAGMLEFWA